MRCFHIALLLTSFAAAAMAQDSGNISKKSHSDYQRPFSTAKPAAVPFHFYSEKRDAVDAPDAQPDICLSLRTMVVARDVGQGDATHLVWQRTCTPAREFQTKAAVGSPANSR